MAEGHPSFGKLPTGKNYVNKYFFEKGLEDYFMSFVFEMQNYVEWEDDCILTGARSSARLCCSLGDNTAENPDSQIPIMHLQKVLHLYLELMKFSNKEDKPCKLLVF